MFIAIFTLIFANQAIFFTVYCNILILFEIKSFQILCNYKVLILLHLLTLYQIRFKTHPVFTPFLWDDPRKVSQVSHFS